MQYGIRCVATSPLVEKPQTAKLREQQPEIQRARAARQARQRHHERIGRARHGGRLGGARHTGRGRRCRGFPPAPAATTGISARITSATSQRHALPAEMLGQARQQRQEHELAAGVARGQQPDHQAAARDEPAIRHRGRQADHAGARADADQHAPGRVELPRPRRERGSRRHRPPAATATQHRAAHADPSGSARRRTVRPARPAGC